MFYLEYFRVWYTKRRERILDQYRKNLIFSKEEKTRVLECERPREEIMVEDVKDNKEEGKIISTMFDFKEGWSYLNL